MRPDARESAKGYIRSSVSLAAQFVNAYGIERSVYDDIFSLTKALKTGEIPDEVTGLLREVKAEERESIVNRLKALVDIYENAALASIAAGMEFTNALRGALSAIDEIMNMDVDDDPTVDMIPGTASHNRYRDPAVPEDKSKEEESEDAGTFKVMKPCDEETNLVAVSGSVVGWRKYHILYARTHAQIKDDSYSTT
jgi:hypothetical protein